MSNFWKIFLGLLAFAGCVILLDLLYTGLDALVNGDAPEWVKALVLFVVLLIVCAVVATVFS